MSLIYHEIGPIYVLHNNHLTRVLIAVAIKGDAPGETLDDVYTCDLLQRPFQIRCIECIFRRQHRPRGTKQGRHTIIGKHDMSIGAGKTIRCRERTKVVPIFLKERWLWVNVIPLFNRCIRCKVDVMQIWKRIRIRNRSPFFWLSLRFTSS